MSKNVNDIVNFVDHECKHCGRLCKNRSSLGPHLRRTHKTSIYDYVLHFYFDDKIPCCACGCRKEVNWHESGYKFRMYVTGHNPGGWDEYNKIPWSEERRRQNQETARDLYGGPRGIEIKKKISDSLKKKFADPEVRKQMTARFQKFWDNMTKEERTVFRKQVWADNYEQLYKKIVTPEFRVRISKQNMDRDFKHTSKAEKVFVEQLRSFLCEHIVEDYWINTPFGSKCFDVYLPNRKTLVEFDGTYWHGLDRDKDFTPAQIKSMKNDPIKNSLAASQKKALLRIKEGTDLFSVKSFADLITVAYHFQTADGKILKTIVRDSMQ